jgi:hypothetical protein
LESTADRFPAQNQAVQERQAVVDALQKKFTDSELAKGSGCPRPQDCDCCAVTIVCTEALAARMSEELAAIESSTVRAAEDRKQAAELLVAISRQVCGGARARWFEFSCARFAAGQSDGRCGEEGEIRHSRFVIKIVTLDAG